MRLALLLLAVFTVNAALAQAQLAATLAGRSSLLLETPLKGEPIQGFSSIVLAPDGSYWAMADTGHGAAKRRAEVSVVFHHIDIDWIQGIAKLLSEEPLRAPDRKLPFRLVNEQSRERLLTAADLNVDAMQVVGYSVWLADDFGPYLVESTLHGKVLAAYAAPYDASRVRRGFGGLAALASRRLLYAAFEGALWDAAESRWERLPEGREFVRILEFDLRARKWTGRELRYPLDANGHSIADLRMIDAATALVLERGPGFRRIYRVALADSVMRKLAFVDLAAVEMATAEGMEVVDPGYVALSNGDRREFVLLRARPLLPGL